ncbi:MAG: phosphoribosylformylglycinamidine synthase [Bdellovibrionaceae bacterium]|nr:phosphoribosylformylglycinamidine synthase [Pseudobdellovibrionaceae bacterium]|tara:strand:- start:190 stop:426 length:237 start_codon:yes stop_codon:yes gene_type:complete
MKVGVKVLPRPEVLDSQGRAVEKTLSHHQLKINQCVMGKYVVLDVDATDEKEALEQAKKITEFVLYNPLVESFEMEVI